MTASEKLIRSIVDYVSQEQKNGVCYDKLVSVVATQCEVPQRSVQLVILDLLATGELARDADAWLVVGEKARARRIAAE
jgi:hypothetical protein